MTSDDFIVDPDRLAQLIAQGVIAVDMETGSVAAVCAQRGVPWSAVRAISDRAEDGDVEMAKLAKADGTPDGAAIARYFAKHPGPHPVHAEGRPRRDARREERGHHGGEGVRALVSRRWLICRSGDGTRRTTALRADGPYSNANRRRVRRARG